MEINLIAPIARSGYGYHSLNIIKSAKRLGHKLSLWSDNDLVDPPQEYKGLVTFAALNRRICNYNSPSVKIAPAKNLEFHVGKGLHAGWTQFELNRLQRDEAHILSGQDIVIVCSSWHKEIVMSHVPGVQCSVVPLGVDRQIFHEDVKPFPLHLEQSTIFATFGKWERRKAQDQVLAAFNKSFTPEDNVILLVACHNAHKEELNTEWHDLCSKCKLADKIIPFRSRFMEQGEVAGIMAAADCGVFPSRAEGWNLELLEMMSMGKFVIATNYSAHTEYCDESNCLLIHTDGLEVANDGLYFLGDGEWAHLGHSQEEQMINHMRTVHAQKQNGNDLLNVRGIETAKLLSWENTVSLLAQVISQGRSL